MTPRQQPETLPTFDLPEVFGEGTSVSIRGFIEKDDGTLGAAFYTTVAFDPWRVAGTVRVDQGRLVLTSIALEPNPMWQRASGDYVTQEDLDAPAGGIRSSHLRAIKLEPLLRGIRTALLTEPAWIEKWNANREQLPDLGPMTSDDTSYRALADRMASAVTEAPKRGRQGYGDEHYRRVALTYLALQDEDWGRGILYELARREERPRNTVATWVREARRRGFLTEGQPGKAGADPGPNLFPLDPAKGES